MKTSALTTALLLFAVTARAQGVPPMTPPPPSLTVNGSGEVRVAPDEATVRFGVTRQASTAQAAQEQTSTVAQAILKAVVKLGVAEERIQTEQLTLYPVYAAQKPGDQTEPRIVAYRAANTVSATLDRLKLIGPVVDAGLEAGSNLLEGVSFNLRNDDAAREKALRRAVSEAMAKARAIAAELGVGLGAVQEVVEGGVMIRPPYQPGVGGGMAFARAEAATPVQPGQVTVSASVTLRYRIQGK